MDQWTRDCLAYCDQEAFPVAAMLIGASGWNDAMRMILAGEAEVIVVARREHLPPDRVPQLRIVGEQRRVPRRGVGLRRPRIIDR